MRLFRVNPHSMSIDEVPPEIGRNGKQDTCQNRYINAPGYDGASGVIKANKPVERSQRQKRYRQNGMTPADHLATNFNHANKINKADNSGKPPADNADSYEPKSGLCPKRVAGDDKSDIRRNQPYQSGGRGMDKHRVDGVAHDRHTTFNGFFGHGFFSHFITISRSLSKQAFCKKLSAIALFSSFFLSSCAGPYSILDPAGLSAAEAAGLWWLMFSLFTVVFLVVTCLWVYAMKRPPGKDSLEKEAEKIQNRWVIGGGIALPLISIIIILLFGIPAGHKMLPLPLDGVEILNIEVTGRQWQWDVYYPDEQINFTDILHIPVNQPVNIYLSSDDVIHSFWVPRLAGKLDAIPGKENILRIQADKPGIYHGQCAEYCGVGHARMKFTVHVHGKQAYKNLLRKAQHVE